MLKIIRYYFNDMIKFEDFDLDILIDEKLYENKIRIICF